jgi:excisionase family DNA binding protein
MEGDYSDPIGMAFHSALKVMPLPAGGFTIEVRPIPAEGLRGTQVAITQRGESPSRSHQPLHSPCIAPIAGGSPGPDATGSNWRPKGRAALSLKEVAETLGLGRTTVYRLIREEVIRVIHIGGRTLVPVEVLDALLETGACSRRKS